MKQCIHCTSVHVVSTYFSVTGQILYYTVLKLFGCTLFTSPLSCLFLLSGIPSMLSDQFFPHSSFPHTHSAARSNKTKFSYICLTFGELAHWLAGLWQIPSSWMCIFLSLPPRLLWEAIYMYSYDHNGKVKGKVKAMCWKSIR